MRNSILYTLISILMSLGLLTAVPAFAQTAQPPQGGAGWGGPGRMMGKAPGVFGTATAISGDTITLESKGFAGRNATSTPSAPATTYSIDASNATVFKDGATSSVSAIAITDNLMVQGTVSGTNVTATRIEDGLSAQAGMPKGGFGGPGMRGMASSSVPQIQGNGEPVIGGSITAISGSSLTVTNKSNVTYSVDATNAAIVKAGATSTLASLLSGDNVIVQGTVNGNSVTASTVIDQGAAPSGTEKGSTPAPRGVMGVFGAIGGFLQHLFGFF